MIRIVNTIAAMALVAGVSHAGQDRPAPKKPDVVKQLQQDFDEARARLQKDDLGEKTRAAHRRIIEGLDKLLEQEDDKSANPPPANAKPPKESSPNESKQPMPGVKPMPMPQANSNPDGPSTPKMQPAPNGQSGERPSAGSDGPWDTHRNRRQEGVDAVGRERFPPRYEELLRAYYRSLSDRGEEP